MLNSTLNDHVVNSYEVSDCHGKFNVGGHAKGWHKYYYIIQAGNHITWFVAYD